MSFFDKSRYFRSFGLFITGIILVFFGIKWQMETPKVQELNKITGIVENAEIKNEVSKNSGENTVRSRLYFKNVEKGFLFNKPKDYYLFKSNVEYSDTVSVWLSAQTKVIVQISKGESIILKYKRFHFSLFIVVLFGVIMVVVSGFYIVKHPEDLTGKKKKE